MAAERYHDLTRLRGLIGLALLAMAWLELAYGVTSWQFLSVTRAMADEALTETERDALWAGFQALESPVVALYGIVLLACYLLGAVWTYGAASNAARLVPDERRIGPEGAVGWYIVPIASLFMPFRAMGQVLNSSIRPPRDLDAPAPPLLRWWWGVWLTSSGLALLAMLIPLNARPGADAVVSHVRAARIDVINTPLAVLSIWLWWQVVTLITHLQKAARPAAPTLSEEVIR